MFMYFAFIVLYPGEMKRDLDVLLQCSPGLSGVLNELKSALQLLLCVQINHNLTIFVVGPLKLKLFKHIHL